jgi:ABC-type molybdate transport system substrate-binding protein
MLRYASRRLDALYAARGVLRPSPGDSSISAAGPLQVWMPGAFARLGPALGQEFTARTGLPIVFAPFRPSGLLAASIRAGEPADVYVSAHGL